MKAFLQYLDVAPDATHAPEVLRTVNSAGREALPRLDAAWRRRPATLRADDTEAMFAPDYGVNASRINMGVDVAHAFHCGVPNINCRVVIVANDIVHLTDAGADSAGTTVCSLRDVPAHLRERVAGIAASVASRDTATAINSLLLHDGVYVRLEPGAAPERPVQIVNIFNSPVPMLSPRRVIVDIADGARVKLLVCDHAQNGTVAHLNSDVMQVLLGRDAKAEIYFIEESGALTQCRRQIFASQDTGSELTLSGTFLSGGRSYTSFDIDVTGDNATTHLAGLAVVTDEQAVANEVALHHRGKRCTSRQIFKYAVFDKGEGVFGGRVTVHPDALFTDAQQNNRNLLMSPDARMEAAPQLEIYCDEVKCSHGATTGQLDERALFYMQSRGIPRAEAVRMLTQAFMVDVIDNIDYEVLRQRLHVLVEKRLSGEDATCGTCPSGCHK